MSVFPVSFQGIVQCIFSMPGSTTAIRLIERVCRLALRYFGFMQAAGTCGFGLLEIGFGYLPAMWKPRGGISVSSESEKVQGLRAVKKIQADQSGGHGLLYVGSGVLSALGEVHAVCGGAFGSVGSLLNPAGWTLFLFANLFSLHQNLKLYRAASRMGGELGDRLKVTAVLGMINNLGYVLCTIFTLFHGMAAIAIALAVLAIMAGTIKFFYDFFFVSALQEA